MMNDLIKVLVAVGIAAAVCGCANQSANMRVGTSQSYVSLKDQREAVTTVQVYEAVPNGASTLGRVDASRCHRNTLNARPSEDDVLVDLKVAAFAKGANGIANVKVTSGSGLLQNCWSILNAEAIAVSVR